jgi:hypothetical protein
VEEKGSPLLIAGVDNMMPLVAAMTSEWQTAMHNATMAALAASKPTPPPGEPPSSAQPNGDAPQANGAHEEGDDAAAAEEERKIGDVVMGEVEVVDLVTIEDKPAGEVGP